MKDYKLSEIKAICEKHHECESCPLRDNNEEILCGVFLAPRFWQIDEEEQDE